MCELSKLNLIPEIMVEVVSENIQIWFDNFIKATFVNTNPSTEQLLVCCNTYIDWRWDRCRLDTYLQTGTISIKNAYSVGS